MYKLYNKYHLSNQIKTITQNMHVTQHIFERITTFN